MFGEVAEFLQPRPDFSCVIGAPCFENQSNHRLPDVEFDAFSYMLELDDVCAEIRANFEQIDECTRSVGETRSKYETSIHFRLVSSNQIRDETDVSVSTRENETGDACHV